MKNELDLARALASKAESDLRMAEIGIEHDATLDAVAFHVQQTAEKLLVGLQKLDQC
jgi:HEPN domain-containing protein